jgi:hypothetical protein
VIGEPCPLFIGPGPQLDGFGRLPNGIALRQSSLATCELTFVNENNNITNVKKYLIINHLLPFYSSLYFNYIFNNYYLFYKIFRGFAHKPTYLLV